MAVHQMINVPSLVIFLTSLVSVCANFCGSAGYCNSGCCRRNGYAACCDSTALIIGLTVGGAVVVFIAILIFCICRRRRYAGLTYNNQGQGVIVHQTTTGYPTGGMVTTTGMQPGVTYPPAQPGMGYPPAQPGMGYPPTQPGMGYPPAQPGFGYPPAAPGQPPYGYGKPYNATAAAPPAYSDVVKSPPSDSGVTNAAYSHPE